MADPRLSRALPVACALTLVLTGGGGAGSQSGVPDSARTFFIGQAADPAAFQFQDIRSFSADVPCLRPGDSLLLQAARTFEGPLHLRVCDAAGTDARPIVVRAFEPRAPFDLSVVREPAIIDVSRSAARDGLQWSRGAEAATLAGIHAVRVPLAVYRLGPIDGGDVTQVFHQRRLLLSARTPSDPGEKGSTRFLRADSFTDASGGCRHPACLTTAAARLRGLGAPMSPLSYAIVRNSPWSFAASRLAGIDTGTGAIQLGEPIAGAGLPMDTLPVAGHGFILVDDPALLDTEGEWWFDRQHRQLFVVWSGSPPAIDEFRLVQSVPQDPQAYTHGDAGLAFWGDAAFPQQRYELQITQVAVSRASTDGIRVTRVPKLHVSEARVEQAGVTGMVLHDIGAAVVERSHIADSPGNGIVATSTRDFAVRDNTIERSGRIANQRQLGMDMNGIRASGFVRATITGNHISDSGFAGVMLAEPDPGTPLPADFLIDVSDNVIGGFCRMLNDCGAIYINGVMRGAAGGPLPDPATSSSNKRISRNRISGPVGNLDGLPIQADASVRAKGKAGDFQRIVGAVFLDLGASDYDVARNDIEGRYVPHGWRIFYQGTMNSCSRASIDDCSTQRDRVGCYTQKLDSCNAVSTKR